MSKFFYIIKQAEQFESLVKEANVAGAVAKALTKSLIGASKAAKAAGGKALSTQTIKNILKSPKKTWAAQISAESGGKITVDQAKKLIKSTTRKTVSTQAAIARKELSKFPQGWSPTSSGVIDQYKGKGLKFKVDKATGDVKVDAVPKQWQDASGKLTDAGKANLIAVEKELVVQRAKIEAAKKAAALRASQTAKIQAQSAARIRRQESWNNFKASLPATAVKGAGVLTGIAGLYAMFSGKPSVPSATPAQTQLISSMTDLSAATQMPSADDTIAALNELTTSLNQLKSGENSSVVKFVEYYAAPISKVISTLSSLKNLSGLDKSSLASYDASVKKLSSDIKAFDQKLNEFQSRLSEIKSQRFLEKINTLGISEKISESQANLAVYESAIQEYRTA